MDKLLKPDTIVFFPGETSDDEDQDLTVIEIPFDENNSHCKELLNSSPHFQFKHLLVDSHHNEILVFEGVAVSREIRKFVRDYYSPTGRLNIVDRMVLVLTVTNFIVYTEPMKKEYSA